MRRSEAVAAALAAAAFLATALPLRAADAPATIRVGATGNDAAAEVYYAAELGFFKKRGLDVQITSQRNGAAEAAAVAGGSLDLGEQNVMSMAHAHARGLNFVFIAPAAEYIDKAASTAMIVAKSSPLRTAKDLEGKTVAVSALHDLTETAAQAWIDKNGGDAKTVKWVEIPFPAMGAALQAHRVDAAMLVEPFVSDAKSVARSLGSAFDAIGPRFMTTGWFATDAWLAKNADVASRFAAAIRRAGAWANDHHKESGEILVRYTRIKPSTLASMTRATYSLELAAGELQPAIDVGVRYGAIPRAMRASEIMWTGAKRG